MEQCALLSLIRAYRGQHQKVKKNRRKNEVNGNDVKLALILHERSERSERSEVKRYQKQA